VIKRYTLPEMGKIWTRENRFRKWLEVEMAVCEVQAERGEIPQKAWEHIKQKADFDIDRIDEIEAVVKHDVIAFLTSIAEKVGEDSRFIHQGMTSSDVLDTATSLQLKEAGMLILNKLERLRDILKKRAVEFKDTACIGRSHGIHAEPTTFGLKFALWYDEAGRNIDRLEKSIDSVSVGKISGAVGTFAHLDMEVEESACRKLGIKPAPVSTQIVQRDRHADYLSTLAIIGGLLEKIAVEIRHLQRTEVGEAAEFFSKGQKGSSAMPHKKNPITCERISGMARLLRSNLMTALENMALWHERDISHSSVERIILPDSNILLDYMLFKINDIVENLIVNPQKMLKNLQITRGLIFSQALLLALTRKNITREDAYSLVQKTAMKCWENNKNFKEMVDNDKDINQYLSKEEIDRCFNLTYQLRNVDNIFKRVGIL